MKLIYLFLVLVFTLGFGSSTYADQVSPHMRCGEEDRMTWNIELQKHECLPTYFTPIEPNCSNDVDYVWKQTGLQSYEQVNCPKEAVTKIDVNLGLWELWEQYAWDFVFSGRFGW